jgi:hypothetical protein
MASRSYSGHTEPGYVYVLTNPAFPGCVKIGGTSRTPTHRALELLTEYAPGAPFRVVYRKPVADWRAVEFAAHRMLSDRRQPRSELFGYSPGQAKRTIRAAARAFDRPGLFRRLLPGRPVLDQYRYLGWRRRGTNWVPGLVALVVAGALLAIVKPTMPAGTPAAIARTVAMIERL